MTLTARDITDELAFRQHAAERVLERFGAVRTYFREWQDEQTAIRQIYRNEWSMRWPDGRVERVDPSIPNMVRIAAEDRAREVDATAPNWLCRPEGPGDEAREKADKLERITGAWAKMNRLQGGKTQRWAMDAMAGGLTVCKVLPDFKAIADGRAAEAFPQFTRLDPVLSYPDPVFTEGPFVESFIYAYEDYRATIEMKYDITLPWRGDARAGHEKVRVIEFYDTERIYVVVEATGDTYGAKKPNDLVHAEKHRLTRCPVVIGTAAKMDGTYSGEFDSGLGVMDYWNRLMVMVMDDALRKVYPERVTYNVENPDDFGPDAEIRLESPDGKYEYVAVPNQAFSNFQVLKEVSGSVRSSMMMPLSRSGDPNESIISASGINATQGQYMGDVRSIQNAVIGPMLEAAMSVALESEEAWTPNKTKFLWADKPGAYRESYVPKDDIAGYRNVEVRYGAMSGLDPINQGVMVLQQLGANILDRETAMELSPFVEDPQRTKKRQLQEAMEQALIQGLLQQAATGAISPVQLAYVTEAVRSDEVSLSEAIAALVPQQTQVLAPGASAAPVAPVPTSAGPPQAPGIAGATEGPLPQNTLPGAA